MITLPWWVPKSSPDVRAEPLLRLGVVRPKEVERHRVGHIDSKMLTEGVQQRALRFRNIERQLPRLLQLQLRHQPRPEQ